MIQFIRHKIAVKRLKALMRPDPDYARRCAAQLPPARRERFLRNLEGLV